jgi:ribosomal protein L11 methyltransferase
VAALLPPGVDPAQLLAGACESLSIEPPRICGQREVEDEDWVRLTQAQFPPTRIGETLWIVPSWHEPPEPTSINIRLDPGVAFGTGTHPTTRLCLAWLLQNMPRGARVLDYGCGSGVLAIAAARLGARQVIGTDIDEQALDAARANSERNAVDARYTAPDQLPAGQFDVVLANILANPLRLLAPMLLARVAPGGSLVLSGVLQRQADELIAAYAQADRALPLQVWATEEGWTCLAGRRFGPIAR